MGLKEQNKDLNLKTKEEIVNSIGQAVKDGDSEKQVEVMIDLMNFVANDAADNGRIAVNGKIVKPSYEVKVGDIVEIKFGDKVSRFEILQIPKVQGKDMGEIIKIL